LDDPSAIRLTLSGNDHATGDQAGRHDPIKHPEKFDGIIWRRCLAFFVDVFVLMCLFAVALLATCVVAIVSLGLVSIGAILAFPVLGVLYDTLCIGSTRSATLGMRAMGVTIDSWHGPKPDYWQSFLSSVLFWTTVPVTSFLILLVAFFDPRGRCLHDMLAGTVAVRSN